MTSEHIYRDWTGHKEEVIRPEYEYCAVEIYSYEHKLTKTFHNGNYKFKGDNHQKVNHRRLNCLECVDNESFTVELDYNVKEIGEYRIDIIYENKNGNDYVGKYNLELSSKSNAYKTKKKATVNTKKSTKTNKKVKKAKTTSDKIKGKNLKFDGEPNIMKRSASFETINVLGKYKLVIEVPYNCFLIGVIIRKINLYTGDSEDSVGTNLELTECEVSLASMTDPTEAKFTIGYSQFFDCDLSRSGFYMDYMDEVNIYFRENNKSNGKVLRRFGGYVSTVDLDDDRTNLKFSCADRLQDGETKYVLDALVILYGTQASSDMEYLNPINFNSYGEGLKYLCNIHEMTLKSNIGKNYLVAGEKYNKGLTIKFGKKKNVKKVTTKNCKATVQKGFITLRNNASGLKEQYVTLYNPIKPVNITDNLTFHMTYGLGATKTTRKDTIYETVDNAKNSAGSQKFSRCGVSEDKKYVMAIGTVSSAKDKGSYGTYYKTVFKNYCPECKKDGYLRWDSCRKDTNCINTRRWNGSKRSWGVPSNETEITCIACDSDYSALGNEKDSPWKKLTKVGSTTTSSKSEQTTLHKGKMVAVPKSGEAVSSKNVLDTVAKIATKYKYSNSASTYPAMKKTGSGDCHAFADCIFTELKKLKVACRIYQWNSGYSSTHREVWYKNSNKQWTRFPYNKYNFPKMVATTNGTDISKLKPIVRYDDGNPINKVTSSKNSKSTQKREVTTTKGYDKDKPIQGYIQIKYSTTDSGKAPSKNVKTKNINLNFTQKANTDSDLSGLSTVWVNNATRQTSVKMKEWFDDNEPNKQIWLHQIRFVTPKIKIKKGEDKKTATWYTFDKSTHDYSSCKMNLYQIIFDNSQALNPTDLQACGKTVQSLLEELVEQSGYLCSMTYGQHRKDDKIYFRIDNQSTPAFVATEGDDNNILQWSNIKYAPVSELRNKSIYVFKRENDKYSYVDTGDINSILKYGEKTTLQTSSEPMGAKEAYFNARNSKEYNPDQAYSYTIVVPYAPNLQLGNLIQVISNYKKLNDIKTVQSIKISFSKKNMPKIRTEIGCDEIEPFLRIRKDQEKLRKKTRAKSTYFGSTASPVDEEGIYIWD